jgi:DNA polymerase V
MNGAGKKGGARSNAGRPRGTPTRVVRLPVPIADLARRMAERGFRMDDISGFLEVSGTSAASVPLMSSTAQCGFASPADDYIDRPLDFNELIIENPAATFAVNVIGESMTGAGIYPGDIAVIDRSRGPVHGCIVLACVDNEFTIKRYVKRDGNVTLHAENPAYRDIVFSEGTEAEVWGVVTRTIRKF